MIVNAGLQKTGTTTFGGAMKGLGYRHLKADAKTRNDHIKGKSVIHRLQGYESCDDHPFPFLLDEIGPERVVLTVRASPETWLGSLKRHFRKRISNASRHYYFHGKEIKSDRELTSFYESHNEYVREWCNENQVPMLEVCWERGDGWNELCSFLRRPIPQREFPWLNKS